MMKRLHALLTALWIPLLCPASAAPDEVLWKDNPAIATPYRPVLSDAEKVAGLSKIWSEARYNFPFFDHRPGLDWDAQYMAFLPQVRAAKTTEDYYRVLARFVATLKEGHARIIAPKELKNRLYGVAPLTTRLIDGKIVVTEIDDAALMARGITPGTELTGINGRTALDYAEAEIAPYVFGFSPQDRAAWTYGIELLRGPLDSPMTLSFRLADGKAISAVVSRRSSGGVFNGYFPETPHPAEFKMLPGNVAYLRIQEFMDDAAPKTFLANFPAIAAADGLIIDIRFNGGGNHANIVPILAALTDKTFRDPVWRGRDYNAIHRSWGQTPGWTNVVGGTNQPDPEHHYGKPVVMLASATTYSAAEDMVLLFKIMKRGPVIGEPTGGSAANPVRMALPGGGTALISAADETGPDGTVFQGTGLQPDIVVKPTIADIRAGRDPVLERAVSVVKQNR